MEDSALFDSLPQEVQQRYNGVTEKILAGAFRVLNTLGPGFLEKVYENALEIELREMGFSVEQQKQLTVYYRGHVVGNYVADLYVDDLIPVEMKAIKGIDELHVSQLFNQLTIIRCKLGLLLNFGQSKLGIRRIVNTKVQ